jgi:TolA-binding protein
LENQIEELKAETESAANASQLVQLEVDAYEKLLNAYVAYAADDVITAGDELAEVDVSYLSENAAGIYSEIETVVNEQYLSTLFEEGYQAYSSGDYETAITDLQAVVDVDEDYRDGYAAYYLAQTFRRNDNLEAAIPYYQYLVDNYPGTERARTAAAYVD